MQSGSEFKIIKYLRITFGATVLFLLLMALLHVIKPEIEPTWRFISEYAIGRNGWLMSLSFFALTIAFLALFLALRNLLKNMFGKIGLVLLLVSAAGLLIAGIFKTDPIDATTKTWSGQLHNIGGTLGIAIPFAILLTSIGIMRSMPFPNARMRILMATIFAIFGFLASMLSMGIALAESNGTFGPDVWVGLPNRFEMLTYCVWLIILSRQLISSTEQINKISEKRIDFVDAPA